MKNFPHQINQLPRLTRGVGVFLELAESGADIDDDGIVGDALAKAKVYTFRSPGSQTIADLLESEHRKPKGSQGTRTCARELRRFFTLLGFIQQTSTGEWQVSSSAKALLAFSQNKLNASANDIWRQALLALELADEGGVSHPYQILLRLVFEMPGLPKPYSGLCLEARNDSDGEFTRIRGVAARPGPVRTMDALAGKHMAKNSIKILPPIAEQLGDLLNAGNRLYISAQVHDAVASDETAIISSEAVQKLFRRQYTPRPRDGGGARREQGVAEQSIRVYDPDRVGARYNAHEDCLDRLSKVVPEHVNQLQAVYDLLLVGPAAAVLVEAKTIKNDERRQVRMAVGQLFYYEHFDVAPVYPNKRILRVLLTDSMVSEDLQRFLTKHEIGAVWIPTSGLVGGTEMGLANLREIDVRC